MSDTLSDMGHDVHIVTYPFGQGDIRVRRAKVHRTGPFQSQTNPKVGPSHDKFSLDFQLLRLLCRVIRRENIDIIHAHNYEGALIGIVAKWLTRRPLLYNAVNLMSDELAGYNFIRPAWLAHGLAHALDWFTPIFPDHITAVSPELREWFLKNGVRAEKVDMVPAGIEPDLFDHPEPEKFRQQYQVDGRPIVSFAGGAKGVRHLHDAYIVANHDCEALGEGIVTLLKDGALAAKLGANARATVLANFDWRQICAKIECIYDRLALPTKAT